MSKICFITAIFGGYEMSCKKFVNQTIETDFICFTDNNNIINNGWTIDTTPYHLINKSKIDDDTFINSLCKYLKVSINLVLLKILLNDSLSSIVNPAVLKFLSGFFKSIS